MLSRVANSLYWMSRYLERAENIARIVDVNLQLLLDFRDLDDEALAGHWVPIVQSTGDEKAFFNLHSKATGQTVTRFLVFQTDNPNSIVSSVAQARENARLLAASPGSHRRHRRSQRRLAVHAGRQVSRTRGQNHSHP